LYKKASRLSSLQKGNKSVAHPREKGLELLIGKKDVEVRRRVEGSTSSLETREKKR